MYSAYKEIAMKSEFRLVYQPKPYRTPSWLRRIWLWF